MGLEESTINWVNPEQWENALAPIRVTLFGIVIDVSPEQLENEKDPMLVTHSGIEIDVSSEHPENAESPMLVTGYPPSTEGTVTLPLVLVGIAAEVELLPMVASAPENEYVHVMPSTVSVKA